MCGLGSTDLDNKHRSSGTMEGRPTDCGMREQGAAITRELAMRRNEETTEGGAEDVPYTGHLQMESGNTWADRESRRRGTGGGRRGRKQLAKTTKDHQRPPETIGVHKRRLLHFIVFQIFLIATTTTSRKALYKLDWNIFLAQILRYLYNGITSWGADCNAAAKMMVILQVNLALDECMLRLVQPRLMNALQVFQHSPRDTERSPSCPNRKHQPSPSINFPYETEMDTLSAGRRYPNVVSGEANIARATAADNVLNTGAAILTALKFHRSMIRIVALIRKGKKMTQTQGIWGRRRVLAQTISDPQTLTDTHRHRHSHVFPSLTGKDDSRSNPTTRRPFWPPPRAHGCSRRST
ncbi:hypothetical protein DFH09DRAFT_1270518 [Mycena vulgaris]|nr:hypothetical protein DFH09DRAFT_1270518 [Mycena vulgaris]